MKFLSASVPADYRSKAQYHFWYVKTIKDHVVLARMQVERGYICEALHFVNYRRCVGHSKMNEKVSCRRISAL